MLVTLNLNFFRLCMSWFIIYLKGKSWTNLHVKGSRVSK